MYVILMSIGAGTAIPGGLFVPSILVRPNILTAELQVLELRHVTGCRQRSTVNPLGI